jgi:hypothetical protein
MIPLAVVMLDVFGNRSAELALAEWDYPSETFVFIRSHEAFRRTRWLERLIRRLHRADSGILQPGAHRARSTSCVPHGVARAG